MPIYLNADPSLDSPAFSNTHSNYSIIVLKTASLSPLREEGTCMLDSEILARLSIVCLQVLLNK